MKADNDAARFPVKIAGPVHEFIFRLLARHVTHTAEVWGCYFPWGIYVSYAHVADARLIAHERMHAKQCHRDGALAYWWRTFHYLRKYGYWHSPYEIEARRAGDEAAVNDGE